MVVVCGGAGAAAAAASSFTGRRLAWKRQKDVQLCSMDTPKMTTNDPQCRSMGDIV